MLDLPPIPPRIAKLPRDWRGYPVPWFVFIEDGKPDFRVVAPGKLQRAWSAKLCWICGEPMGRHRVSVIGPMCVVNRVTSEPPCHRDCAEFAATACPFLIRPRQKRDAKDLPEDRTVAGNPIARNPGAVALYETSTIKPFTPPGGGTLFQLGPADCVDWYANGRIATRDEVMQSIVTGYPILEAEAEKEGQDAMRHLRQCLAAAVPLFPAA